ncbi:MAG: IS3 family transposase [Hydrogenophaga sp.]|jgi:putative transposase|nr:IS3 family transposase [Hydrogenophaga sp.]MBW0185039.1 IS3 family transposase [Hydrogenophaga sp.]
MRQSFVRSDRTYGARRVWHDVLGQGQTCGLHRVERLMREQALRAGPRRRWRPKDRSVRSAVTDNVLDRQFQADGPNPKWVADFTYSWTGQTVPQPLLLTGSRNRGDFKRAKASQYAKGCCA